MHQYYLTTGVLRKAINVSVTSCGARGSDFLSILHLTLTRINCMHAVILIRRLVQFH